MIEDFPLLLTSKQSHARESIKAYEAEFDVYGLTLFYENEGYEVIINDADWRLNDDEFACVFLHEVGHIVGSELYNDLSESFAHDFAYDMALKYGIDPEFLLMIKID